MYRKIMYDNDLRYVIAPIADTLIIAQAKYEYSNLYK